MSALPESPPPNGRTPAPERDSLEDILARLDRRLAAIERRLEAEPLPAPPARLRQPADPSGANGHYPHYRPHPIKAVEHELRHLKGVVDEGQSGASLLILVGTWLALVLPLVALVSFLAWGVADLVTGSPGWHYPPGPAA